MNTYKIYKLNPNVVGLLEQKELTEPPMLVISRIRRHMMNDGDMMDVDEITHHLSIKLIGIVFDDDEVISYSNKGEPIVLNEKNPLACQLPFTFSFL